MKVKDYLTEAIKLSPAEKQWLLDNHDNNQLFGMGKDNKWYVIEPFGGKVFVKVWTPPNDKDVPPGKNWTEEKKVKLKGMKKVWSWDLYV
jgi:hypothetical protein